VDNGKTHMITIDVRQLIEKLGDADPTERLTANQELVRIGKPAVPSLIPLLKETNTPRCWQAASILGQIGDQTCVPAVIEALESHHPILRQTLARVLGELGGDAVLSPLRELIHDNSVLVQLQAVKALGILKDTASIPALVEILQQTQSESLRYTTIEILGKIGSPDIASIIEPFKDDPSHHVRKRTEIALSLLKGQP
jgi:HEAT repeat protein